jgi:hypothetical protein
VRERDGTRLEEEEEEKLRNVPRVLDEDEKSENFS